MVLAIIRHVFRILALVMQYLSSGLHGQKAERMKDPKAWLRRWGPAILVMAVIFIASSTPGNDIPGFGAWDLIVKKGGHMTGYALLAICYMHALAYSKSINRLVLIMAILLAGLYAATDEFHQALTPGRTPSMRDVGIDALGAVIGALTWAWIKAALRTQPPAMKTR
jgi:hypothetical protein